jgi:hypothetical protein
MVALPRRLTMELYPAEMLRTRTIPAPGVRGIPSFFSDLIAYRRNRGVVRGRNRGDCPAFLSAGLEPAMEDADLKSASSQPSEPSGR